MKQSSTAILPQFKTPKAQAVFMCLELYYIFGNLQVEYRQLNFSRVWIDQTQQPRPAFFLIQR